MVWTAIRRSAGDIWDELLYLIAFNVIWLVGTLLIIPWPFVTFGLFFVAHDIGEGKGISFKKFFEYAHQMWKPAYIWGSINLGVLIVLWINLSFYGGIETQWAAAIQIIMLSIGLIWLVLQLVVLPLYPRLEEPGFRLALRNAAIIIGRHPLAILALIILVALILVLSYLFLAVLFLATFAIIAVVSNRMVAAILGRIMQEEAESE